MMPARRTRPPEGDQPASSSRWMPWQLKVLVVLTVANYAWQVPYYLHFYGRFGKSPGGLTVPLLLTFVWFLVGTVLLVNRRRGGVPVMAPFLVVEALFYLVHNLTGAAGRDLSTNDPVLFVASLLGYLNAVAAILFLEWLLRARRETQPGPARR